MRINIFWQWLLSTLVILILYRILDWAIDVHTTISFMEAGFIVFVVIWCDRQDELSRQGDRG